MKMNFKNVFVCLSLSYVTLSAQALRADEKDLYDFLWLDPDKKVYVLQNKVHKKEHTVYANVGIGTGLSSDFQDTSMFHANAGFFFTEEWGIKILNRWKT